MAKRKKKTNGASFIGNYSCDRAVFVDNGKYGVLNLSGGVVLEPRFSYISSFVDDIAIVTEVGEKQGIINKNGDWILMPQECPLCFPSDGMVAFMRNGVKKVYGIDGKLLSQTGSPVVGLWGFFNSKGEEVIPADHQRVGCFSYGLCPVVRECKKKFIDKSKKKGESIKTVWLWGFINKNGTIVIPCMYDLVRPFVQERSVVKIDGECAVINTDGLIIERMS